MGLWKKEIWNRLRHHFDLPISPSELEILRRLLPVALAETETEAGFANLLHQMLLREIGLPSGSVWRFTMRHLAQYRRPWEAEALPRTFAQRFLADPPFPRTEQASLAPFPAETKSPETAAPKRN